jgi:integrase
MQSALTPTAINAAIRAARDGTIVAQINDDRTPGLNLRVGKKWAAWTWLGRDAQGRVRRFPLGRYPHVGLAEARRLARAMSHDAPRGADPIRDARTERARMNAPIGHTLADLLALYGQQANVAKSWGPQMEPQIRRVFHSHLDTALATLTVGALQMTVDRHPKPKSASFAVRCLLTVLRWAVAPGRAYVDRDLLGLQTSAPKPSRDRVLSRDELAKLLPALRASNSAYASAMRAILLTAVRRGEVEAARWQDINFTAGTWTLPAPKNGKPHVIPLSRQAGALLRGLQPAQVDPEGFVFTASGGRPLATWDAATDAIQAASGTTAWTRHDLRRTAATTMGEAGVPAHVIEAALNHSDVHSALASVYNKSRYRNEVADALQRLADVLDGIEQGGAEVIPIGAVARS